MRSLKSLVITCAVLLTAALPLQAPAALSVSGGGYVRNAPSQAGGALIVSSGDSIPAVPVEVQGSLFVPVGGNGGYAATAEIRGFTGGGTGGAYVGAGIGLGSLSSNASNGTVFTIFAGKSIAPRTSIELRLYKQTQDTGATVGYAGLRFSL